MLKKITVEDRREMLVAELRKRGDERPGACVPLTRKHAADPAYSACALGLVCVLWPDLVYGSQPSGRVYTTAAQAIGIDDDWDVVGCNDDSATNAEVADKLEKLFARLPVAG